MFGEFEINSFLYGLIGGFVLGIIVCVTIILAWAEKAGEEMGRNSEDE